MVNGFVVKSYDYKACRKGGTIFYTKNMVIYMKNNLLLNTVRGVKRAPGRFIAIMAIIAISCAFYSGIKVTCPNMKQAAWKYYDDYALADIHIKSTLGFGDKDAECLMESGKFESVYAGYSADLLAKNDPGYSPVKVMSYSADYPLNKLYIVDGRLPEKPGECIADADSGSKMSFKLGDTVTLSVDGDDELSDYIDTAEYTVVGLAKSPLYVKFDRGATNIGNGTLSAFMYIPEEHFTYETYTDIYMSVSDAHESDIEPFSARYEEIVAEAEEWLETESAVYLSQREASIRAEAEEELSDAREKLSDGEKEYNDGKKEFEKGKKEYNDALSEMEIEKVKLEDAEKEYNDGIKTLEENEAKLTHLADTCVRIDNFFADYTGVYLKVLPQPLLNVFKEIQAAYNENGVEASIEDLMAIYIITDPEKEPETRAAAETAIKDVNEQVRAASAAAMTEIKTQKAVLEEGGAALEEGRETFAEYEKELAEAKSELEKAQKELDDAQQKIDEANAEIADAEADLNEMLADGEWLVWNREEFNPDCSSYGKDADRVDSIAAAFPVFFIIIAALMCSTTMSRMVEEQRTEAGTLKALGYSSFSIIMQYVMYAVIASVIGSTIGTLIGLPLLPKMIYICYETMYNYPEFETPFVPGYLFGCMGVSLLCTGLASVYTSVKELSAVPALLIRPKPPKNGKRIFLEKIGFIWKKMKFSSKVTFRNLLRYKSRFLMTVIGIGGCTALLLTAFGLREAISCIADKQYEEIFLYDALAVLGDKNDEEDNNEIKNTLDSDERIKSYISAVQETKDVFSEIDSMECYILAPETTEGLTEYICLRDRVLETPIEIEEGCAVITEKTSNMLGVGVGDTVTIAGAALPVKISAITENYTFHYLYMTQGTYEALFGKTENNLILINTGDTPEKSVRDEITSKLVACDGVVSSTFMYDGADSFRKLVSSLNLIVVVLIVFAGALSFVILYNLANININERVRELATIKVLGFFDNEVGAYVYRENVVSAVIGIAVGLFVGIFFEAFVVATAEVDEVMFSPDIEWFCFVIASALMVGFNILVNAVLYFKLKKIDMASSMKAIE